MNRISLLIAFWVTALTAAYSQNVSDILRFSSFDYSGTARFIATGGAMGPLGADLSVAGTNPAGLAQFRRSEFAISPTLFFSNTDSRLENAVGSGFLEASRTAFNLHNIGAVVTSRPRSQKWTTMNFAFGINNLANYNRSFVYEGATPGSIAQRWQELANSGLGLNDYETDLAERAGVLYDFEEDGVYEIDYAEAPDALLFRRQEVTEKGSASELSLSLAGNYDERLMIGLTVGVPFVSYRVTREYTEADDSSVQGGNVPWFESLAYREEVETTGAGINAKLGMIFRLHQAFRLSGAIHTPTAFTLDDTYRSTLTNNYYEDADETGAFIGGEAESSGGFNYDITAPWRYFAGAGFIFGAHGFLTAEMEFVDFTEAKVGYDGFFEEEQQLNQAVRNDLKNVVNVRLGAEAVYDIFRFRAGLGIFPSAYQNDDTRRYAFSGGIGIRETDYFIDLAYRRLTVEEQYLPYVADNAPLQEVFNESGLNRLVLTIGAKF